MQTYSEVYGLSRDEIVKLVGGEEAASKLTMQFIRKYPAVVAFIGSRMRKQRARMMVEAMQKGSVVRGNVGVRAEGSCFVFSYRGTDIMLWETEPKVDDLPIIDIVTDHDHTFSTRNQRKVAREAIEEFSRVVQGL